MNSQRATFGAGCFWHIQEEFDKLDVIKTTVGYMGGDETKYPKPSYKEVSSDKTGFIEVVQIEYNPEKISYKELLDKFWKIHDPTSMDQQGADIGTQYKSVVFFHSKEQEKEAKEAKDKEEKKINKKIVTEIRPAQTFFKAEDYHQNYYKKTCKT